MRRKVLQDFAKCSVKDSSNLPSGYDLATFVHLGSGFYFLDILTGNCSRDSAIPPLMTVENTRNGSKRN